MMRSHQVSHCASLHGQVQFAGEAEGQRRTWEKFEKVTRLSKDKAEHGSCLMCLGTFVHHHLPMK